MPDEVLATTDDKTRLHLELYYQMAVVLREIATLAGLEDMREIFPKANVTEIGLWARRIKVEL